ncbi:hypothetical protein AB1Y20_001580 [Prymnesium parvum]|uniref:Uncharacterized protein n=1 Tax=Prymnesium parvum TaxID=97485 RepID=A0AB34KE20_PRYPA
MGDQLQRLGLRSPTSCAGMTTSQGRWTDTRAVSFTCMTTSRGVGNADVRRSALTWRAPTSPEVDELVEGPALVSDLDSSQSLSEFDSPASLDQAFRKKVRLSPVLKKRSRTNAGPAIFSVLARANEEACSKQKFMGHLSPQMYFSIAARDGAYKDMRSIDFVMMYTSRVSTHDFPFKRTKRNSGEILTGLER